MLLKKLLEKSRLASLRSQRTTCDDKACGSRPSASVGDVHDARRLSASGEADFARLLSRSWFRAGGKRDHFAPDFPVPANRNDEKSECL